MSIHAKRFTAATMAGCVMLAFALPALAQTKPSTPPPAAPSGPTGKIVGKVMERGTPLGYANIILLGTRQGAASDESGSFVIPGVPVGTYQVKLMATGYDPVIQSVQVNAG